MPNNNTVTSLEHENKTRPSVSCTRAQHWTDGKLTLQSHTIRIITPRFSVLGSDWGGGRIATRLEWGRGSVQLQRDWDGWGHNTQKSWKCALNSPLPPPTQTRSLNSITKLSKKKLSTNILSRIVCNSTPFHSNPLPFNSGRISLQKFMCSVLYCAVEGSGRAVEVILIRVLS